MKGNPRVIIAGEPNVGSWHSTDMPSMSAYWEADLPNGHVPVAIEVGLCFP